MSKRPPKKIRELLPKYWWDFHWQDGKIDACTVSRAPRQGEPDEEVYVAKFLPSEKGIEQAEKLISALHAGRISEKTLGARHAQTAIDPT